MTGASPHEPAAASGEATNPTKPVTSTQARFFMDDGTWPRNLHHPGSVCPIYPLIRARSTTQLGAVSTRGIE
jgi:hypothetical protein